jgi:hypothetical protein
MQLKQMYNVPDCWCPELQVIAGSKQTRIAEALTSMETGEHLYLLRTWWGSS